MPQYMYVIKPTRSDMLTEGPTPEESKHVQDHFNTLLKLSRENVVLLAGRTQTTDPSSFGIVILQAADHAAAQQIMENDPAVKHGVMSAELFPYHIAVLADEIPKP